MGFVASQEDVLSELPRQTMYWLMSPCGGRWRGWSLMREDDGVGVWHDWLLTFEHQRRSRPAMFVLLFHPTSGMQ